MRWVLDFGDLEFPKVKGKGPDPLKLPFQFELDFSKKKNIRVKGSAQGHGISHIFMRFQEF
jgi:hypothetical protein